MSKVLGQCVGLISGNEWRSVRMAVEHAFLRKNALAHIPIIWRQTESYFGTLHREGKLNKGLIEPAADLKMLPFWVVAEVVYGDLSPEMIRELIELAPLREQLFRYVIEGGLARFSWSKHLPTKANRSLAGFQVRWKAFNDLAYKRAVALGTNAPIVNMYEAVHGGHMELDQLYQTLDESLYANLDVTIGGISWNLVFLAAYPEYQTSLLAEINAVHENGFDSYIQSSSTLLASCIYESSRLKPLAAFSVPQSAPTTRVVGGYIIPAGTNFVVDSYALNIRNEFWGHDSEKYRPERFLEKSNTELRYHFWRFGFGPRQCMGKYVADLMIRILLVHVIRGYELSFLSTEGEWKRNSHTWITHPDMTIRCVRRKT